MRVLVTGASGNLASALIPLLEARGDQVVATDLRPAEGKVAMDICDYAKVLEVFGAHAPERVFHLAAETDVDRCETEPDRAYRINAFGSENVALACAKSGAEMVCVSTAEVFDGLKPGPYHEFDRPGPVNIYGKSKLAGEDAARSLLPRHFVVRTAWLTGAANDSKFVAKILKLIETRKEIQAVSDKRGSPTFVSDLAANLLVLADSGRYGTYHCCNRGVCTRYDMAVKMMEVLKRGDVKVVPVSSDRFPLPAPRGPSEAMVNYKLGLLGLDRMPSWEDSLRDYLLTRTRR